ncbi:hypothetical protein WMY93_028111 [Mugilogobius chulae]|uniref:Uncharacterized protein n=1 Tax=Mugilogobius chulae TaxID=88201 RepID=A0AAW0MS06_9GOBI
MFPSWIVTTLAVSPPRVHPPGHEFILQATSSSSRPRVHPPGHEFILQATSSSSRPRVHPPGHEFIQSRRTDSSCGTSDSHQSLSVHTFINPRVFIDPDI